MLLSSLRSSGFASAVFTLALAFQSFGLDCLVDPSFDRAFYEKWTHVPSGASPILSRRDTVYAGASWGTYVFFKGYTRDDSNKVNLALSCKILKPDGTLFHDTTGISAISGFVEKDTGVLLSGIVPVFSFSRKDMPGAYKIVVKAEDKIAKTKKTRETTVILAKYPNTPPSHFNDISLNIWVHSYCIEPDPGRVIAAFSYFIGSAMSDNNEIFWPVFYFFQCVFNDNPFLIDQLVGKFPKASQRLREYIVFLLRSIRYERSSSQTPIPDSLWTKFDKVAATGFYDPFTFACKVKSNKFLEFCFYSTGRYSIVRFLIDCLGLNTPAGRETFIRNSPAYSTECQTVLDTETTREFYLNAINILKKTCVKHPLVNAYCNYTYERGNLEPHQKSALKEIILPSQK
jgi:hypothetical protein